MEIQIKYATTSGGTHEHITHVGNDAKTWTLAQAVASLDSKQDTMFVQEVGKRAEVRVRQGANKRFLQTYADGVWGNNLLALPACKVAAA
jgi:hypothetical protein